MISEQSAARIRNMETRFHKPVRLVLFTSDTGCASCPGMLELARAIKGRSGKIALETYDLVMDRDKTEQYGVTAAPALVVQDDQGRAVAFYGMIEGILLDVLLAAIASVADAVVWFPEKIRNTLAHLANGVSVRVFVENDCAQCRPVSETAAGLALQSPLINSSIIVVGDFPELVRKYGITSLPVTLFGENLRLDGHVTESEFLEMLFQAEGVKPSPDRKCLVCGTPSPDLICTNCRTKIQAEAVQHKLAGEKLRRPDSQ